MRHIFLAGHSGIGKSTIINQVLEQLGCMRLGGFRTVSLPSGDPTVLATVHIEPPDGAAAYTADNCVGIRRYPSGFSSFPHVFDSYGCQLLRQSGQAQLLIMDELGMMESDAPAFTSAVLTQLDGGIPVLGVVKYFDTPFLAKVKGHPSSLLLKVDKDNRDQLIPVILSVMAAQINK